MKILCMNSVLLCCLFVSSCVHQAMIAWTFIAHEAHAKSWQKEFISCQLNVDEKTTSGKSCRFHVSQIISQRQPKISFSPKVRSDDVLEEGWSLSCIIYAVYRYIVCFITERTQRPRGDTRTLHSRHLKRTAHITQFNESKSCQTGNAFMTQLNGP